MGTYSQEAIHQGIREPVFLGFGDLFVSAGDHIGHFYQTREEWKEILIPFLKEGLEAGDQCVYLMNPAPEWQEVHTALQAAQIDVDRALSSGQLILEVGKSSPQALHDWLTTLIAELPGHYRLLRWGGDMTWSLRQMPTSERLMEWETMCNPITTPPAIFLCQYDLTQFFGSVIMDALKTHPLCILGQVIHRNPFYIPPAIFLEELRRRHPSREPL